MIYERFKKPIIDFIERADKIPNLVGVVLFGSAVTGDVSKKSDIDLLLVFDCDHNPEVGKESKIVFKISSEIATKEKMEQSFSFVFYNQRNPKEIEPDFLWNVAKEGKLIWGKCSQIFGREPHPSLEPLTLIKYSLKGLSEKNRRAFLRSLYGTKKGGKFISKKEERLGPATLLIKAAKLDELKEIFARYGVRYYSAKKLWGH